MEQDPKNTTQGDGPPDSPAPAGERDVSREVSVLESLLLVSTQPLGFERIGQLLGGISKQEVAEVVRAIRAKYPPETSGILVEEVAKGIQLRTNPANQEFVRRLYESRPPRFTRPSLETLAVVAYHQPVTRLEIEQIRGVDCAAPLKTLMDRRLVKVAGKKDVPGRPFLFATTREFLEVFSLSSLSELPSMHDIEEFLSAKTGTQAPEFNGAPDLFAGFGGQAGAGEELAEELREAEHGDLLVTPPSGLPDWISDEVLVEAASGAETETAEMKPLVPSGKGSSKFSRSSEQYTFDPAEPLVTSSFELPEVAHDGGKDPQED